MKSIRQIGIIVAVNLLISNIFVIPFLHANAMLTVGMYFKWEIFCFVVLMLFANVLFSHKFASGKKQEWLFFISTGILISAFIAYIFYCLVKSGFKISGMDWIGCLTAVLSVDFLFYGIQLGVFILFAALYLGVFDRKMLRALRISGLYGNGKLKSVEANLENSRWMTKEERNKIFKNYRYSALSEVKKDGVPVMAELDRRGKDLEVVFNSPCHSLIIGSTGSGKTTTFVNPMIQLLAATGAGSSMIMTDPKGELFSLHSAYLKERGYDVNVVDLRDTYASYRWNPLDGIWENYRKYATAQDEVYQRTDDVSASGLKLAASEEEFAHADTWYEFDGRAFVSYAALVNAIKIFKKKTYDEVYEDLNDLVSVLIPVENEKDPMWEKGARAIVLAVLLAMLEDSEDESLSMTKEKFNFFNMTKILQNSNDDYLELRRYFGGRSALSKAYSLSKQVCDAAETTRASYMSVVYEKLTLFNDAGICALTSASDFVPENLAEHPTALFLKIPDEKSTRHNLAAIFILNIYKSLIKVASQNADLSLPRNVYFILDEFGNMPKIENFDKMITVGRSRKIWFNMIIQSYAQLNNVYGDKVADIVKGNCGIKMFIGSNDMGTCKEFSEQCGNITVVTTSTSGTDWDKQVNVSAQTQVRPLIYPSDLQRLNKPGDLGHSVVVTFGNYPLKTYFTPSFRVPFYKTGAMSTSENSERFFDENAVYYDISVRNSKVLADSTGDTGKQIAPQEVDAEADVAEGDIAEAEAPVYGTDLLDFLRLLREQYPDLSDGQILQRLREIERRKDK